jgi:periplasmic protein TonB
LPFATLRISEADATGVEIETKSCSPASQGTPMTKQAPEYGRDPLTCLTTALGAGTLAALIAGCQSTPMPPHTPAPVVSPPPATAPIPPPVTDNRPAPPPVTPPARPGIQSSSASTARDYRRDGARHLYQLNAHRIYSGKLPPLLYAIGVLETELDSRGQVLRTSWLRAPRHAPEVIAEIENTVRRAAPFPAPSRLGRVTYTETWLWDKSGRFQLDTLTEGQQ